MAGGRFFLRNGRYFTRKLREKEDGKNVFGAGQSNFLLYNGEVAVWHYIRTKTRNEKRNETRDKW